MTTVERYDDAASLATDVARRFVALLAEVQAAGRIPQVALTGGTIADRIHKVIATTDSAGVDWTRVDFFWGDDRFVPADSSDRNDRSAGLDMLDALGVDPLRVHAIPAADEAHPSIEVAAQEYGDLVRTVGQGDFDLVMLGVGPDGHVASLFPDHAQLHVQDRIAVAVTDSPKPPPLRISLTFAALNRAEEVWFVVSGEEKADAVARALADEGSLEETPARGITVERATWFVDREAASELELD